MAINQINKDAIQDVCITARDTKNVRAVSFNFHTPYPDTKKLALSEVPFETVSIQISCICNCQAIVHEFYICYTFIHGYCHSR